MLLGASWEESHLTSEQAQFADLETGSDRESTGPRSHGERGGEEGKVPSAGGQVQWLLDSPLMLLLFPGVPQRRDKAVCPGLLPRS